MMDPIAFYAMQNQIQEPMPEAEIAQYQENETNVFDTKTNETQEKSIDELLSRFDEKEQNLILSSLNEYNEEFLDEVLQLSYFNGSHPYTSSGIKMVMNSINETTKETAQEILSQNLQDLDYMPYELAEIINPNLARNNSDDIEQDIAFEPDLEPMSVAEPDSNNYEELYEKEMEARALEYYKPYLNMAEMINSKDPHIQKTQEEADAYEYLLSNVFEGSFNDIYLERSTNEECIALENEMADMGVRATFADNLEDARLITDTYRKLYNMGYELPKEIVLVDFSDNKAGLTLALPNGASKYAPIFYQKGISSNDMTAGDAGTQAECDKYGLNWFSSDNPSGVVAHEVGHYNQKDMTKFEKSKIWQEAMPYWTTIGREVSAYSIVGGLNSSDEFVAEVFAGLYSGKEYNDDIMQLYYSLGGVWNK